MEFNFTASANHACGKNKSKIPIRNEHPSRGINGTGKRPGGDDNCIASNPYSGNCNAA